VPEVQCLRIRLAEGTTARVASFLRGLADREAEVAEALEAEGIDLDRNARRPLSDRLGRPPGEGSP
jgi:hypothetical protein